MSDPYASIECPCAECGEEARPGSRYCCEGCALDAEYQRGRREERAAVVGWLRGGWSTQDRINLSHDIERRKHLKGEE